MMVFRLNNASKIFGGQVPQDHLKQLTGNVPNCSNHTDALTLLITYL